MYGVYCISYTSTVTHLLKYSTIDRYKSDIKYTVTSVVMEELSNEGHSPGHRKLLSAMAGSGDDAESGVVVNGIGSNSSIYESVHVLVRVRPLSQLEVIENQDCVVDIVDQQSLTVTSSDGKKVFKCSYDSVLGMSSTQSDVYNVVRSCTESVLDGFNSTIFAYGQTGSGKVSHCCCFFDLLSTPTSM